jgi:hypothetical protein
MVVLVSAEMTVGLLSIAGTGGSILLNPLLSQRNIINLNFNFEFNYAYINHVTAGDQVMSPFSTGFTTPGSSTWMQLIDQTGYPNNAAASGVAWGGGVRFPKSSDFAGPYVVTWDGDGKFTFTSGTWTEASVTSTAVGNANGTTTLFGFASVIGIAPGFDISGTGVAGGTKVISVNYSNKTVLVSASVTTGSGITFTLTNNTYTKNSNGTWTNTSGVKPYILVSNSGFATPANVNFNNQLTGGTAFATNARIYRQVDEVDGAPVAQGGKGYIFRAPFKQLFVNLNPAAIRFLNWMSPNNNTQIRFENRSLPSKSGLGTNWVAGPAYGETAGTNAVTLAASAGTAGNPNVTTASMVHGEIATTRMLNAIVRSGNKAITAITQAPNGQVTAIAHGFSNGDQVIILCGTSQPISGNPYVGMVELNYVVVTVAVVDADNFTTGINTTTFTAFTVGTKAAASCCEYITLQVGSGNDRTAYPVVSSGGSGNIGTNAAPWGANTYQSFTFDKNIAASRSAGTIPAWNMGVWTSTGTSSAGNPAIYSGGTPIEYCAALIIEINTLAQSQGISNPVHAMFNMPGKGLQPVDPNYTTASDWGLNQLAVLMNGANGFSGLIGSPLNPSAIMEYSNETWNFFFTQTGYLAWLNFIRNGTATTDNTTMSALRSTIMARNITANSPYRSRIKLTLGCQGSNGSGLPNSIRLSGASSNYFSDTWNTWQGGLTPISQHDAANWGSYFDPSTTYMNTVAGTGTFTDDSAMYNGTDNTVNGGGNYVGVANPTQAIVNFVANQTGQTGQTIKSYCDHASPSAGIAGQFSTLLSGYGKRSIGYEGGTDWHVAVGESNNSHVITADDSLFLNAVNQSSQWATAQIGFFNDVGTLSVSGLMPLYTFLSSSSLAMRWAYAAPDTYAGGVEGAALTVNSPLWVALGVRNQALSA